MVLFLYQLTISPYIFRRFLMSAYAPISQQFNGNHLICLYA